MTATAVMKPLARRVLGPAVIDESLIVYRLHADDPPGVLLEVGAHRGDDVLQRFAADGWEVHAFEPDPENFAGLAECTAHLDNVTAVQAAVSDAPGRMMLYTSPESEGISTLKPFIESHEACAEVEVLSLRDYLARPGMPSEVDVLKIDVEGFEQFVLQGYPWETHRPQTLLLEFEDRKTVPLGYSWHDLATDLVDRGYDVVVSEWAPIVRYGTMHQWRRFDRYPCELADPDGWGNLIATTRPMHDLERITGRDARRLGVRRRLTGRFSR